MFEKNKMLGICSDDKFSLSLKSELHVDLN